MPPPELGVPPDPLVPVPVPEPPDDPPVVSEEPLEPPEELSLFVSDDDSAGFGALPLAAESALAPDDDRLSVA